MVLGTLVGCVDADWTWEVAPHFPIPEVPEDNPMTVAKVDLGRHLFYDVRMSVTEDMSCGSCHIQSLAFTDGRGRAVGATGQVHPRGAMSLANVAYASRLAWANPLIDRLESQALLPMFGESPVEMGLSGREEALLGIFRSDERMSERFETAWPDDADPVTLEHITQALASFERAMISDDSPYDRYLLGDESALGAAEQRGMELFFSERTECSRCHGGFNFTDFTDPVGRPIADVTFHNTGLYNLDGVGSYPEDNTGIHEITGRADDMGRFRAPTLRNVAVTGPYMHDGSVETLEEVVLHYAMGGRTVEEGPYAGIGANSPLRSDLVGGFVMTDQEMDDLVVFLESLTDTTLLTDPALSDPF